MGIAQLFDAGKALFVGVGLLATAGLTGCQSDMNGQVMPSAHASRGDIRYYPSGPEFKLSNEAAAMEAYRRKSSMPSLDQQSQQSSAGKPACNCASCSHGQTAAGAETTQTP